MNRYINIVAFDVPYPADYGGVIDIYHKIRWLHALNVKVILHCFQYGRKEAKELETICEKVYYYPRSKYKNPFIGNVPYIILTRSNDELLSNLLQNNYPILFEGLHTTFFINNENLKNRVKLVRTHNIEHDYYKNLELVEPNFFKKYFFRNESDNLRTYENSLSYATQILAISPADTLYFEEKYKRATLVSAFHSNDKVDIKTGKGNFILYHGNLGVGENNFAALYLVKEVFKHLNFPIIIAGNNPSKELKQACAENSNITLKEQWSNAEIMNAIANAHINVLPTFQGTGIKLKLLNALYVGRFCVVNPLMVNHTQLETACTICTDSATMVDSIKALIEMPFTEEKIEQRKQLLEASNYNNKHNAETLLKVLNFE